MEEHRRRSECVATRITELRVLPSQTVHSTAQHSTAPHRTAQHSAAQHSTAQQSTAQHSTAKHSTAQHEHDCGNIELAGEGYRHLTARIVAWLIRVADGVVAHLPEHALVQVRWSVHPCFCHGCPNLSGRLVCRRQAPQIWMQQLRLIALRCLRCVPVRWMREGTVGGRAGVRLGKWRVVMGGEGRYWPLKPKAQQRC